MEGGVDVADDEELFHPKKRKLTANSVVLDDNSDADDFIDQVEDEDTDADDGDDDDYCDIVSAIEASYEVHSHDYVAEEEEEEEEDEIDLSNLTEKQRKVHDRLEAWYQEQEKTPPLYNSDVGELDISAAVKVKVNGRRLKKTDLREHLGLVDFMYHCRQKRYLELFNHKGDRRFGGLGSRAGKWLTDFDRNLAVIAINKYQEVKRDVRLKLKDLEKVNDVLWGRQILFITFSAENEDTGEIKTYQAALADYLDDDYVLGLFRDAVDPKVLAIILVTVFYDDLGLWELLLNAERTEIFEDKSSVTCDCIFIVGSNQ